LSQGRDPERSHTWPQRLLIVFNSGLVLVAIIATSAFGYFYWKFGEIPTIDIDGLDDTDAPSDPQNFLLVGSDTRAFADGETNNQAFGTNTGPPKADTIMLVRVDPRSQHAWVLSFPRDLLVDIAPDGHEQRINTAYSAGAENLVQTIKDNFDVPIHHYADINFRGLEQVVNAVGGVKVYLPSPVRDWDTTVRPPRNQTGLLILSTGCVTLHGDQAVQYVRSRHFQYKDASGQWQSQEGDLDRNKRQQDFVRRTLRAALSKGFTNPARINRLANAATGNLNFSGSLNLSELVKLGRNFRSLSPDAMTQLALPVTPGVAILEGQRASILRIADKDRAKADEVLRVFRGTPEPEAQVAVEPADVTARVRNGSGVSGQAATATLGLQQIGFGTQTPSDSPRTTRTTLRYGPGQKAKAELIASYLGAQPVLEELSGLQGVDVELITGTDFEGVRTTKRPAASVAPATTTTVAPAATPPVPDC
jgi:LCP family protein required for cell wall assembly